MSDAPRPSASNVALLIDADNASPAGIDPVLSVLAELGTVNIRRAYGNWAKPALNKSWAPLCHRYGIEPQQQFDITKGKNATDMKMTIDAMDLLFRGRVDAFGIMSSDSDFMPLAMRLRQDNITVYGFGNPTTPEGFREACNRFIDVSALVKSAEADNGAAEAAQPANPSASEGGPVDDDLIDLLGRAWKASKRDEAGYALISEVGQRAGNRSSFDTRNYGHASLSKLFAATDHFHMKKRENDGQWVVKRVR